MMDKSPETTRPVYLSLPDSEFKERIQEATAVLSSCRLCPRNCGVDRTCGQLGFCRTGALPSVASHGPHFGEEAPLVGSGGSGAIFFGGCNLGCVFCQNYDISRLNNSRETTVEGLASIMLSLQAHGCCNINLVTPTHQVPMIIQALHAARGQGLALPIIFNCGGYESLDALKLLDGIVDIYMPDIKFSDNELAYKYCKAKQYWETVAAAVKEMHAQVGDLVFDSFGTAKRGLLVRHLIMPEGLAGTAEVVRFLSEEISKNTYLNLMDQYHPCYKAFDFPELSQRPTREEYNEAVNLAEKAGLKRLDHKTVFSVILQKNKALF